eukprot:8785809-Pyramimonas_sp.AAC.1
MLSQARLQKILQKTAYDRLKLGNLVRAVEKEKRKSKDARELMDKEARERVVSIRYYFYEVVCQYGTKSSLPCYVRTPRARVEQRGDSGGGDNCGIAAVDFRWGNIKPGSGEYSTGAGPTRVPFGRVVGARALIERVTKEARCLTDSRKAGRIPYSEVGPDLVPL